MRYITSLLLGASLTLLLGSCAGGSGDEPQKCWSDVTLFSWSGIEHYSDTISRLYADAEHTILLSPDYTTEDKLTSDIEHMIDDDIAVWILIGANTADVYPTDEYISKYLKLAKEYNQKHTKKIAGVSLDIEVWTKFDDQRSSDNAAAWEIYLKYIADIKKQIGTDDLELSVEIPRWLDAIGNDPFPNNRAVSSDIIDIVDELVIMNYTNDIEAFYADAKGELEYADEVGKRVKLALELGTGDPQRDIVSFYANPEGMIPILTRSIDHISFSGYAIHALDDLYSGGLDISTCIP